MKIIGIDYGSKLAGTTVIASLENESIAFAQSEKKRDADQFVLDFVKNQNDLEVFIDAPLSLPAAFYGKGEDYFYRACDRALKGMSPMFLGGLTARAIKLKSNLEKSNHTVLEVYPGALARHWELTSLGYKKEKTNIKIVTDRLKKHLPYSFNLSDLKTWHHVDALLAFIIGFRHKTGNGQTFGDESEGIILI